VFARGAGQLILPESDPGKIYDRLFSNPTAPATGMTMGTAPVDPAVTRLRLDRKSTLDHVRQELSAVRCQLGGEDRVRFDAHLSAIEVLERQLEPGTGPAPTPGSGCAPTRTSTITGNAYAAAIDIQTSNTVAALCTGATRVVGLQLHRSSSSMKFSWLDPAATCGAHDIAHNGVCGISGSESDRLIAKIETWYSTQFALLLKKLDSIPEPGGTMLDNTAVLWVHEQASAKHTRNDNGFVIAGSCGGYFKMGRALNFGGKPHASLLASMANAMGVPTTGFGSPSAPPLSELVG
jgi:hypothetical protein